MTSDALRDLWTRHLAGEPLALAEEHALREALEADPDLRAQLLSDDALDGSLRALGATDRDSDTFAREFADRLIAEENASRFIRKVESLLPESGPAAKPPSRRRAFRRAPLAMTRAPLPIGLVAAAVFVALVSYLVSSTNTPTVTRIKDLEPAPPVNTIAEDTAARLKAERERLEAEAARGHEERRRLAEAEGKARDEKERAELKAREAELARTAAEVQEKLQAAREKERETAAKAAPSSLLKDTVAAPPLKPPTQAGIARVVRAEAASVKEGDEIAADQALEVGPGGQAVLVYPDKTRLQLGPETEAKDFNLQGGKRLTLVRGTLQAEVAKQPKDQPLVITTPQGQAKVLGTTLRLSVDPKGTRLEVEEGRVEFKRRADQKTVTVESGRYAVAAPGVDLAAKPIPAFVTVLKFDFDDAALPPDWFGGSVDPGPDRAGKNPCLAVTEKGNVNPRIREARLERSFVYADGTELRFDYWVKAGDDNFGLTLWDETSRESLEVRFPVKTQGKWTRAVVSLADFRLSGSNLPRVKDGHQIGNIFFSAGEPLKGAFYLDNVEVVKPRK